MSPHLDFCSREAAHWADTEHHYSRGSMPSGRLVNIGAWETERFIGAIVFGRGASSEIGSPFGLRQDQVCELCRVALGPHTTPTSKIVSIAVRLLHKQSPGLRLIVSFADPEHGHVGVLYQAMNWLFIGTTNRESLIRINGRLFHPRTVGSRYRTRSIDWLRANVATDAAHVRTAPKFRYVLPLDADMRRQLQPRVQPYPKASRESGVHGACGRAVVSDVSSSPTANPGRGRGSTPLTRSPFHASKVLRAARRVTHRRGRCDATCSPHVQEPTHG